MVLFMTHRLTIWLIPALFAACSTTQASWVGSTERLSITSPSADLEVPSGFPMVRAPVWLVGESILDCVEQYRGTTGDEDHAVEVRLLFSADGVRASLVQSHSDRDAATSRCVEQVLGTLEWHPTDEAWPVRVIPHPLPGEH